MLKLIATSRNLQKTIGTYPNISKPIETYRKLLKPIQTYRNLSKPIKTYRNLSKAIETCRTNRNLGKLFLFYTPACDAHPLSYKEVSKKSCRQSRNPYEPKKANYRTFVQEKKQLRPRQIELYSKIMLVLWYRLFQWTPENTSKESLVFLYIFEAGVTYRQSNLVKQ